MLSRALATAPVAELPLLYGVEHRQVRSGVQLQENKRQLPKMRLNMELIYLAATVAADRERRVQQSSMMILVLGGSKLRSAVARGGTQKDDCAAKLHDPKWRGPERIAAIVVAPSGVVPNRSSAAKS